MAISYKQIFSVVVIASLTSVLAWGGDPWSREHYEETRRKHRSETLLPTENCYKYQWQCHEPKFGPRTMSCDNRCRCAGYLHSTCKQSSSCPNYVPYRCVCRGPRHNIDLQDTICS